jgi:hypothetical protein
MLRKNISPLLESTGQFDLDYCRGPLWIANRKHIAHNFNKMIITSLDGKYNKLADGTLLLVWGGRFKSGAFFKKGTYHIRIITKGTEAFGEMAKVNIYLGNDSVASFSTTKDYSEKLIVFNSQEEQFRELNIDFINDISDPKTKQDRNVWLKPIVIKKVN